MSYFQHFIYIFIVSLYVMNLYNVITQELTNVIYNFTRGQFRPSGIVVGYVCVYVRPCVCV